MQQVELCQWHTVEREPGEVVEMIAKPGCAECARMQAEFDRLAAEAMRQGHRGYDSPFATLAEDEVAAGVERLRRKHGKATPRQHIQA